MAVRTKQGGRKGIYRLTSTGPYRLRRQIPEKVRHAFLHASGRHAGKPRREFDISLGTHSAVEAAEKAADQNAKWEREIALAMKGAVPLNVPDLKRRLAFIGHLGSLHDVKTAPSPGEAAFNGSLAFIGDVGARIAALQAAVRSGRYDGVERFDTMLAAALRAVGVEIGPDHPSLPEVRSIFANDLLYRLVAAEQGRVVAAASHHAERVGATNPDALVSAIVASQRPTISTLITAFKAERIARHGQESTDRKYAHLFSALEEILDPTLPVADLKRADCREVRDFLRRLPSNASKRYRGKSLQEAIDLADASEAEVARLAPNTVNSYLSNLIAMLTWAVKEEWIATNPASGLVEKGRANVRRRGFRPDELTKVFEPLEGWRRDFFAILLYSGARAGEIAQLRRGDVRQEGSTVYLSLEEFDEKGRRVRSKRLKSEESERIIPLHRELIRVGVGKRLLSGDDPKAQVFPEFKETIDGYTHELSKWWGRHLDKLGMSEPSLTMHSFRHGFRDAGRRAGLDTARIEALGGWAIASVGESYGDRGLVEVLERDVDRISYGSFTL